MRRPLEPGAIYRNKVTDEIRLVVSISKDERVVLQGERLVTWPVICSDNETKEWLQHFEMIE